MTAPRRRPGRPASGASRSNRGCLRRQDRPGDDPQGLRPRERERTVKAKLGGTLSALLTVRSAAYSETTSKSDQLIQSTVNGLRLGLLLALASVGLSLIYGTTGLSNFAHAEQVTLGGMLGYFLINVNGLGVWIGGCWS